jgi:hypothetical protein
MHYTTKDVIPIAYHFTSGKTGDAKAIGKMIDKLSPRHHCMLTVSIQIMG